MKRILVIDDDAAARYELSEILTGLGFDVYSASDGRDGLKQAEAVPIDLVITDILMPEMEGLEFIMTIKKTHPGMKVVAISGGGRFRNMSFLEMAKKFGADEVFEKPLPLKKLLANVAYLITQPSVA